MLSLFIIFATALFISFVYFIITSVISWHRLRTFPGSPLASVSYLPMLSYAQSGQAHIKYFDISRKYGSIVRIGPNDLLVSDPDVIRRMSAARSTYSRSSWYRALRLDPYHDSMASARDVGFHDRMKVKTTMGYTGKDLPTLEAEIDSQILSLVRSLRSKCSSEIFKPIDFGKLAQFFTLDTLTAVAFGKPFGFLEKDYDIHDYLQTTEKTVGLAAILADVPWLQTLFLSSPVLNMFGPKDTDNTGVGKLMG